MSGRGVARGYGRWGMTPEIEPGRQSRSGRTFASPYICDTTAAGPNTQVRFRLNLLLGPRNVRTTVWATGLAEPWRISEMRLRWRASPHTLPCYFALP